MPGRLHYLRRYYHNHSCTGFHVTSFELAIFFHGTYERLAPKYGYKTRKDTKQFDPDSPNGKLMIAVCERVIDELAEPKFKRGLLMGCNLG